MANKVFVDLGFNFNGSGVTSAVGGIGKITGSIKGMDSALGSVTKTLKSLKNAASLMLAVQGTKSIFGGISSIGKTIKDGLKREFDFVADLDFRPEGPHLGVVQSHISHHLTSGHREFREFSV